MPTHDLRDYWKGATWEKGHPHWLFLTIICSPCCSRDHVPIPAIVPKHMKSGFRFVWLVGCFGFLWFWFFFGGGYSKCSLHSFDIKECLQEASLVWILPASLMVFIHLNMGASPARWMREAQGRLANSLDLDLIVGVQIPTLPLTNSAHFPQLQNRHSGSPGPHRVFGKTKWGIYFKCTSSVQDFISIIK